MQCVTMPIRSVLLRALGRLCRGRERRRIRDAVVEPAVEELHHPERGLVGFGADGGRLHAKVGRG